MHKGSAGVAAHSNEIDLELAAFVLAVRGPRKCSEKQNKSHHSILAECCLKAQLI